MMSYELYLNGVYKSVLDEIRCAQAGNPGLVCYLQPYASRKIAKLAKYPPTFDAPITAYISLTSSLSLVSFRAKVVGWENKDEISSTGLGELNAHIQKHQPREKEIFMRSRNGKPCINLISVVNVEQLEEQIPISNFVKISPSDQTPLKLRSRSGGWSYVKAVSD